MRFIRLWLALLLASTVVTTGCKGGNEVVKDDAEATDDRSADGAKATGEAEAGPTTTTVRDVSVEVEVAGGGTAGKVRVDGGEVTVEFGGKTLSGKPKGSKRAYEVDGAVVALVKADGGKLKLKDEGGKLLWKVKIKDAKVKISDNEEGENAYSIKTRDDGSFKVKRGDAELGKVKFYPDDRRIKVKAGDDEKFRGEGEGALAAYGALLLEDVPEAMRWIIFAELAMRNR